MAIEHRHQRAFVGGRPSYHADLFLVGHAGEDGRFDPRPPIIAAHLDQAIVGAGGQQARPHGGNRKRVGVAIQRGTGMEIDGVCRLDLALQRQRVAAQLAGQIRADAFPRIAAITAAEHHVGAEIQRLGIMRGDDERRAPIPAIGRELTLLRLPGLNALLRHALAVGTDEATILRLGIEDVRISRICHRVKAIAARQEQEILVGDAVFKTGADGAAPRSIVLGAAIDVIERLLHVGRHRIKLHQRQIGLPSPALAAIARRVHAAIIAQDQVIAVLGVDPHRVIVGVDLALEHIGEALAAIVRSRQRRGWHIDPLRIHRIAKDFAIIPMALNFLVAPFPRSAAIG